MRKTIAIVLIILASVLISCNVFGPKYIEYSFPESMWGYWRGIAGSSHEYHITGNRVEQRTFQYQDWTTMVDGNVTSFRSYGNSTYSGVLFSYYLDGVEYETSFEVHTETPNKLTAYTKDYYRSQSGW